MSAVCRYYRRAHIIVVVFDLTLQSSLDSASKWLQAALKETDPTTALIFLVGAKYDLLTNADYDAIEPKCLRVANTMGAEFWTTSARTGYNVEAFFGRISALGFEALVLAELETEKSKKGIGTSLMGDKSFINLNDSNLFERDQSATCCKIGK